MICLFCKYAPIEHGYRIPYRKWVNVEGKDYQIQDRDSCPHIDAVDC
jgi:hypothetical protein